MAKWTRLSSILWIYWLPTLCSIDAGDTPSLLASCAFYDCKDGWSTFVQKPERIALVYLPLEQPSPYAILYSLEHLTSVEKLSLKLETYKVSLFSFSQ